MWKQKIGMSVSNTYPISTADAMRLLAKIGFDAVSPVWSSRPFLGEAIEVAKECGLELQSLHAPFHNTSKMWNRDEEISAIAMGELMHSLEDCHRWEIPVLVVHTWIGFGDEKGDVPTGLKNFGVLVDRATELGVKIAFENTEGLEYLEMLMTHFKDNPTVGFCWDSGHEMCYNGFQNLLEKYGDRLLMTHLNDNLGVSRYDGKIFWTDDLHLLPYDGIADWDDIAERLKKSADIPALNFELKMDSMPERHENDLYMQMGMELYFTEAYKRACRVARRVSM